MKTVLISGFEPFGGDKINPSLEALKSLQRKTLCSGKIVTVQVPVVRYKCTAIVVEAIKKYKPDVVLTVGQAGGRLGVTPERVAVNIDDFRIADNEKNQPIDQAIVANAPAAYFSTLPLKAIVRALRKKGIPSALSNSAGTFVCNHLFYGVQHYIVSHNLPIRHGFMHIPLLPEQALSGQKPSLSKALIVKALTVAAQVCLDFEEDIVEVGGEIC